MLIGHSVIGDDRHAPRRRAWAPGWPGRLWLHARALVLLDGETFEDLLLTALLQSLEAMRLAERAS